MKENNNWFQSVTGVLIKENRVLVARHTYGSGAGYLIVPGGYAMMGESPQEAVKREYMEEVGIEVEPREIIAIRFTVKDWYVAFSLEHISGVPRSDGNENSEVIWLEVEEALKREDVPDLTKLLIKCKLASDSGDKGLVTLPYVTSPEREPYSLYGVPLEV